MKIGAVTVEQMLRAMTTVITTALEAKSVGPQKVTTAVFANPELSRSLSRSQSGCAGKIAR